MHDKDYWEERYKQGKGSGEGSIGSYKKWKWEIIKHHVKDLDDILDVGCGDLSFWEGQDCQKYTGIDFSSIIIENNQKLHPDWKFIVASASDQLNVSARIVLCLDVLFHIMDENTYIKILNNLGLWSNEWLLIFTWEKNPFDKRKGIRKILTKPKVTDGAYQYYRDFSKYVNILESHGFILLETRSIDLSPSDESRPIGAMYVFKKVK
ncbi:MAG: class I SAM-dependent methyltransferase [Euryarchaeota archaeon]|nr:class I SAM-dependent methyltransferase [Euryarchaeota archaeon]MBU4038113.1 class I SAM-dependent methyltransferase [Pseudomonadota bacterium]